MGLEEEDEAEVGSAGGEGRQGRRGGQIVVPAGRGGPLCVNLIVDRRGGRGGSGGERGEV